MKALVIDLAVLNSNFILRAIINATNIIGGCFMLCHLFVAFCIMIGLSSMKPMVRIYAL